LSADSILVHDIVPRSEIYGPGPRWVIWVQGCSLGCEGCWNKDTWAKKSGSIVEVSELLREIRETDGIEGITILGGEPLQQAVPVLSLITGTKSLGLTVMLYTGFEPSEFDETMRDCYEASDIAITGRFVQAERDLGLLWRGSSNQVIESPSGRYSNLLFEEAQEIEIHIDHDTGAVTVLGYPDENLLHELEDIVGPLRGRGE